MVQQMIIPVNYDKLSSAQRKFVRESYVKEQNEKCYYCRRLLEEDAPAVKQVDENLFPIGFFRYPVHLHHDHITGLTIGAVHAYCNAVLWQHHGE